MYYLIFNPAAGNGHSSKVCEKVKAHLDEKGISYRVLSTEHPGHAGLLAVNAVREGASGVLCIGGDGTVSETIQGMIGSGVPLGIIPAGTGNDFIKTLGISSDPMEALDFALTHPAKATDAGIINERPFANECGTGFDVMTLDYADKAKKHCSGLLPYLYGVICTILHYKPTHLTYSLDDGEEITEDVLVFAAGNGRIIGGGICICPEAVPDDGLFDIVIVKNVKKWKLPFYLVRLLMGKILGFKETVHCRAKRVRFSSPGMRVNIDGEVVSMSHASVYLSAGSLMIYRP